MATIKQIAKKVGVSATTVSNVLNNKGGASEEKKKQILSIADELNYTPNILAKNLKSRRTKTIGIIIEDLTVFNTPEIVDGIDAYCEQRGYEIIMGNLRLFKKYNNDFVDTEQHHEIVNETVKSMISKQIEGLVYVGYHCREIKYTSPQITVPLSYVYCYPQSKNYYSVIYDDEKAAYDMTQMLIKKGHTKIAAICGSLNSFHTQERLKGFQQALYDNNILYNFRTVFYGDWERDSGYAAAKQFLNMDITAIFCFNDIMASGVFEYCGEYGIQIGKDISLVGFDNREISTGYKPKLTTIKLPLFEIGQKAAELVINSLEGIESDKKLYKIPCEIIERDSVCSISK